ncbi:prephenate dehydrogenase/arogenate dehydrogenase family protein [Halocalculus aciditolerans]|uniref:Prephenate dehydrogenase n=1 Tax=Halocalculus aciditolerans TaxID=1383812 RepID=A0A830FGX2_9EURY|nr:prephenate dehydrogenase/arogenate dehydrogenase family protein [Halocalculus aciditolerans]GGL54109.1 prephenate dehydrogenase [Halocalculus aciditolerans]
MEVLVVGAGEMGRWFADAVDAPVAFADADRDAAEAAASALDARVVPLDGEESFGVVCIAVPMSAAVDAIEAHAPRAQQAVVDVTGRMAEPLAAMARVAPARERVSFHPLFAGEHAPGRIAVAAGAPGPATDGVRRDLDAAGNELVDIDPGEHDEAMQTIQGRTHAAILAFGLAADDVPDDLATPVYEELVGVLDRVGGGNPEVYREIQSVFGGASEVAAAAERLAAAVDDPEAFAEVYDDAGR